MTDNAFGWLLVAVFALGVWVTFEVIAPRLSIARLWGVLAGTSVLTVLLVVALMRVS